MLHASHVAGHDTRDHGTVAECTAASRSMLVREGILNQGGKLSEFLNAKYIRLSSWSLVSVCTHMGADVAGCEPGLILQWLDLAKDYR
jgi:hypothetical protein